MKNALITLIFLSIFASSSLSSHPKTKVVRDPNIPWNLDMKLFAKILTGRTFIIDAHSMITVEELRERVIDQIGEYFPRVSEGKVRIVRLYDWQWQEITKEANEQEFIWDTGLRNESTIYAQVSYRTSS